MIKFHGNDADNDAVFYQSYKVNDKLDDNLYQKDKYIFLGWNANKEVSDRVEIEYLNEEIMTIEKIWIYMLYGVLLLVF